MICTSLFTLVVCHPKRGRDAIDDIAVLPADKGIVMHDGLSTYDYLGAAYAQCCAHLVRALAGVGEVASQSAWTTAMEAVLFDAKDAVETAAAAGLPKVPARKANKLRRRYDEVLAKCPITLRVARPSRCQPRDPERCR